MAGGAPTPHSCRVRRGGVAPAVRRGGDRIPSAALFCRNLGLLLSSGVALPESLRILADMSALGRAAAAGPALIDRVRQGGRLSDALAETQALPALAVRTLRLGESSGRLPSFLSALPTSTRPSCSAR